MNVKWLSISIIPMLLIGSGPLLANVRLNKTENWHLSKSNLSISQVKIGTQQPPPLYLIAKDDKQKECVWLGLCDGKTKK